VARREDIQGASAGFRHRLGRRSRRWPARGRAQGRGAKEARRQGGKEARRQGGKAESRIEFISAGPRSSVPVGCHRGGTASTGMTRGGRLIWRINFTLFRLSGPRRSRAHPCPSPATGPDISLAGPARPCRHN
jgi:hypothetical protein